MTLLSTKTLTRLPKIQDGLRRGQTIQQIAESCNVYEKTIDRDLKTWLQSGEFETWLREEFIRLHNITIHEDPIEAYRQITSLVKTTLTRKIEAMTLSKQEITLNVVYSEEEKNAILNAYRTISSKHGCTVRPDSLH